MTACNPFTEIERDTWAPPEAITGSEWAESYRVLGPRVAAVPGPYRIDRAPYVRGILDALSDEEHTEIYFQKPVQSSGSELGRCWLGYCVDVDPGPIMIVFPSQESCRENVEERIVPMFEDSPRLTRLLTGRAWDVRKGVIHLRTCSIYTGWSGSPQALASRPIRFLVLDEVDKYTRWRGVEADPISLAKDRTLTYGHRRKVYALSTPTIPTGPIARAVESCGDVRDYHFRCRACDALELPDWSRVTWPDKGAVDEEEIKTLRRALEAGDCEAVYKCTACDTELYDAEVKWGVKRGAWVSAGHEPGDHPVSESVGFRLSGICSLWLGIQRLAVEYVAARLQGMGALQNFHNAFLGVPFWDASAGGDPNLRVDAQRVYELQIEAPPLGEVPAWATCVVVGADTGKHGHPYVVRAFGEGYRSVLVAYGEATSGDEILELASRVWVNAKGHRLPTRRVCIDAGGGRGASSRTRTEDVYRLAQKDPARVWPIRGLGGAGSAAMPIMTRESRYAPQGGGRGFDVRLSTIDTGYFKDLLAGQINAGVWVPARGVSRDYVQQVASEKKVLIETKIKVDQSAEEVWRWVVKSAGIPNHFWDCEVYALVAAHMVHAGRERRAHDAEPKRYKRRERQRWRIGGSR